MTAPNRERVFPEIPRTLDDIIRKRRDSALVRLGSDAEIAALRRTIPATGGVDGAVSDWRFITFTIENAGRRITKTHLLGDNARTGVGTKITSAVVAVDLGSRQVATHSGSIYQLVGPQGRGEPTIHHLLMLCAALWTWGRGEMLGVPHVYY